MKKIIESVIILLSFVGVARGQVTSSPTTSINEGVTIQIEMPSETFFKTQEDANKLLLRIKKVLTDMNCTDSIKAISNQMYGSGGLMNYDYYKVEGDAHCPESHTVQIKVDDAPNWLSGTVIVSSYPHLIVDGIYR